MTDAVEPSGSASSKLTAGAIRWGAGNFIAEGTQDYLASWAGLTGAPLNQFDIITASGTSFNVTFDSGEGFARGKWFGRDTQTTLTLPASATTTVAAGWEAGTSDTVKIAAQSSFAAQSGSVPICEFTTDANGVANINTSVRPLGVANADVDVAYSRAEADAQFISQSGGTLSADLNFGGNDALNVGMLTGFNNQIWMAQTQLKDQVNDNRTARPANPTLGQEIFRTDTDPQRKEIYTTSGWKKIPVEDVFLVIEDWEDGTVDPWLVPASSGSSSIVTSPVYSGTYAFRMDNLRDAYSHPNHASRLPYYPQPGDHWSFHVRFPSLPTGSQFRFFYGTQTTADTYNSSPHYEIHLYQDGTFRLQHDDGTTSTTLATSTALNLSTNTWFTVDHWWQHPDWTDSHRCTVTNESTGATWTLTGNNTAVGTGGVAMWQNAYPASVTDLFEVRERTV